MIAAHRPTQAPVDERPRIVLRFTNRWTRRTQRKIVLLRVARQRHACCACFGEIRRGDEHWGGIGGMTSICLDCAGAKVVGRA